MLMSDYELLMIVLAIITLVVTVLMNANLKQPSPTKNTATTL